jgi:hypothetical protein
MPKFDVKLKNIELPELPPVAAKPIYAGLGATDLAVEKVKAYATDVQAKLTAKVADVQKDATARVADVQKSVKGFELPEPKALQDKAVAALVESKDRFEAKLVDLQADAKALPTKVQTKVDETTASATAAYADLAKRGETVVTRIRKGETPAPVQVTKKAPAKKAPAKKAPAKKATTAKKAPAKKTTTD